MRIVKIGENIDRFQEHSAQICVPDETIAVRMQAVPAPFGTGVDLGLLVRDLKEDPGWKLLARLECSEVHVGDRSMMSIHFRVEAGLWIVKTEPSAGLVWLTGDSFVTNKNMFLVRSVEPSQNRNGYMIIPV